MRYICALNPGRAERPAAVKAVHPSRRPGSPAGSAKCQWVSTVSLNMYKQLNGHLHSKRRWELKLLTSSALPTTPWACGAMTWPSTPCGLWLATFAYLRVCTTLASLLGVACECKNKIYLYIATTKKIANSCWL